MTTDAAVAFALELCRRAFQLVTGADAAARAAGRYVVSSAGPETESGR